MVSDRLPLALRFRRHRVTLPTKGNSMGKEARIGLLLGASACLLAVMVDWVIEELNRDETARSHS